ncbi:DNA polymerase zeta catalytic subunit [Scaptodrosophila lebanonensis]|uniref:DNA polymerase zeta catalytic subunit n=1 Tax=Drosophila lebanonensis TaxID=7225 RepID=A0A6J2TQ08_DROLE|nr:DNA polymerase zeta catalytic subunit [Scaptodrosophila lebanonensis]
MSESSAIFSIRLVIADFYMEKPIFGLDPCYSELRGKEIKRVPIVRVFGANADGQKTCMHVHGVFPYLYIPYDKKDFESLERGILQIAIQLDKAINISLGQGSSNAQHVFKIQLVKGVPFYGYHRTEHQFLKIYMFNPRFVRRAANLLQSGAILSKNFNPHESHVPYILQFMIDYNLYGMSYLHVPVEVAKFRRTSDDETVPYPKINPQQLLDPSRVKKVACSALELDINANFILNRFQIVTNSNTKHTNPGIEAIWMDEHVRRQKLAQTYVGDPEKLNGLPPLELPPTQPRTLVEPAESDIFYRTALQSKLLALEQSVTSGSGPQTSDLTLDSTIQAQVSNLTLHTSLPIQNASAKEQRRTFNLQKLLANSVYPEECTQAQKQLVNASFIQNHVSNSSNSSILSISHAQNDDTAYLDDTLVDEELEQLKSPVSVPLDSTFSAQDLQLLDALQQLEEENANEPHIDLDSSLAPLTQTHKNFELTPELLDKQIVEVAGNKPHSDASSDSEEETAAGNLHDFSTALDDIDELLLKLTQSQQSSQHQKQQKSDEMPQMDGADDLLQRTPKKKIATKQKTPPHTPITPKGHNNLQSPRTPKSSAAKKYAALPLIFTSKSAQKNELNGVSAPRMPNTRLSLQLDADSQSKSSKCSLRKKLAISELRRKSVEELDSARQENEKTPIRRSTRVRNLDKTHITCSLTPRNKNPRISDVFLTVGTSSSLESIDECINPSEVGPRRSARNRSKHKEKNVNMSSQATAKCVIAENSIPASVLNSAEDAEVVSTHISEDEAIVSDTESDVSTVKLRKTPNLRRLRRSFRETLLAKCQAASSPTVLTEASPHFPVEKEQARTSNSNHMEPCTPTAKNSACTPDLSPTSEEGNATPSLMTSFYEHSILINSPSVFSDDLGSPRPQSQPIESKSECSSALPKLSDGSSTTSASTGAFVITPLELPPSFKEVLQGCRKLGIHEYEFQQPFYSNPVDISKMKEVGFLVLQIAGNKLNDCEHFQSVVSNGLDAWRRKQLINIAGPTMLQHFRNEQRVCEYFSSSQKTTIEPVQNAPSRQDAKVWLKAKELLKHKGEQIETQQQRDSNNDLDSPIKIKRQKVTMMLNPDGNGDGAGSGDEDLNCSGLTLTPMTPGTPHLLNNKLNDTCTPVSSREHLRPRQRRSRRVANKLSFKAQDKQLQTEHAEELPGSSQNSVKSSQSLSSEQSATSSAALAELERSSFARQVQSSGEGGLNMHELSFGLSHATLNNTFGFKVNLENLQQAKADIECNYLTTITLELFVPTRADLMPDPQRDEIRCLFYAIDHSMPLTSETSIQKLPNKACGYIIVNDASDIISEGYIHGIDADIELQVVGNESEAFEALLALCARWDADIYAGYEIEMGSWGYVIERAKYLCFNIAPLLSRVPTQKVRDFVDEDREQFTDLDVEMKICGRILLDVWRLMRSEIALTSYSFENVMYHILHKRCPWHSHQSLTNWFASSCTRWIVIEYYLERVRGTLALLDQLDLLGRTSEMAKLIGIQFYEVLSRGSQFRVESMMLRIAKPKNLVPLSPSVQQRAHMRAPEYLALIMEPQSRFYADPVIVLDFQSLYPSMIIAYNYCFSTCLGRVEHLGSSTPFEFGASQLRVSRQMLDKLLERDLVTVSPCGVVFVKASVREGILPRMLSEILDTRQMVKQSMKLHKQNTALQRILHSRQLGLKLMANVTYGYTAANFSGRMPAVEVGDSVVAKGRETLERAIKLVDANDKWNVRVVYGDTDSMFVHVPGRNRAKAFEIGAEIAEAVTNMNPQPVKLKLEKVYQPCILQTKKRYVGYMYETPDQTEPVYEAKGIETVRRDGCPAVAKMLEKVLRILFETADVSKVKQYVCRQFTKLLSGRANLQDLIFAKEFRGLNGYKPTACVPALEMTRKWMQNDPRRIPRRGERVPFIIINGPPGVPLIRLVRNPHELLANEGYKINAIYYITKAIIPPLNRCLLLIGADVNEWFTNLPRKLLLTPALSTASELVMHNSNSIATVTASKKSTISQYFSTTNCIIDCGRHTKAGICDQCARDESKCVVTLHAKMGKLERAYRLTQQICQCCCGRVGDLKCGSLDCPVLYVLEVKRRDLQQIGHLRNVLEERF